jgi:hypothetical protein
MLRGEHADWNALNVAALAARGTALTARNRAVLDAFGQARIATTPWQRMAWLRRSGAYRQSRSGQLMLWLACILRRL